MLKNLFLMILLLPLVGFSQTTTVSGKVHSAQGTPLLGVNVIEKGTNNGVVTDVDGIYSIEVDPDSFLQFSYVGFETEEVNVGGRSTINIVLEEDASQLQEVILQGFTDVKGRARKRLELIQEVPEGIVAFSSEEIDMTAGVMDIGGFLTQIPGVNYGETQDPGTVLISIRGIPQIRYGPSPIATVVDGVYLASPELNNQALFDIEQVEVIKGSQGLFYGKNAIGGAVIITTKQPTNDFQGKVGVGYGNGNTSTVEANISGPIVENNIYYRIGVNYLNRDGLIKNTFLDEYVDFREDIGLRGMLKFELNSRNTLSFTGQYAKNEGGAITYVSSALNDDLPGMAPNTYEGTPQADFLGNGSLDNKFISGSYERNFDNFRLLSYTSYADVELFYEGDYLAFAPFDNYGPIPAVYQDMTRASRTFNEELRLVSTADSKLNWNLGLFYQHIDSDWITGFFTNEDPTDYSYSNTTRSLINNDDNTLNSIGLFGFLEYDFTERLNISAGLRNEWESLRNVDNLGNTESKRSYSAFQPKIAVSYDVLENKMLYASYSRGFRSGAYNPIEVPESNLEKEVQPEFTNSLEIGAKTSFWNNRFIFNMAYFHTVFENQQIYRFITSGDRSILGTLNYEESKIDGIEFDAKLRLSKHFDLSGGASFISSEITKAFEESAIGNKIPFAPQSSYNIGLFSRFSLGETTFLKGNINVENKGKKYWFADDIYGVDQEEVFQDPYTLINGKIALEVKSFTLAFWGKNIFNTKYNEEWWPLGAADGDPTGGPIGDIRTPSQPRTYGVELSYKF